MKSILKWVLCLIIIIGLIPVVNNVDTTAIPIVQFDAVISKLLSPFDDEAWASSVRRRRLMQMQRRRLDQGYDVCNEPDLFEHWPLTSDATGACNSIDLTTAANDCGAPLSYSSLGALLNEAEDHLSGDCLYTDADITMGDDFTAIAFVQNTDDAEYVEYVMGQYWVEDDLRSWAMVKDDGPTAALQGNIGHNDGIPDQCGSGLQNDKVGDLAEGTQYMLVMRYDDSQDDMWLTYFDLTDCSIDQHLANTNIPDDGDDCQIAMGSERFIIGARRASSPKSTNAYGWIDAYVRNVMFFTGTDTLTDAELVQICNAYK